MFRFPTTGARHPTKLSATVTADPGVVGDATTGGRLAALWGTERASDHRHLTASTDAWVAAVQHNLNASALCRLPPEVLLGIMRGLDAVDIFCLRRTSRVFLRLFGSHNDFGHLHDREPFLEPGPWVQQAPLGADAERERMSFLLKRDYHYCADCKMERADPNFDSRAERIHIGYLHCHGCRNDHPASLFSSRERAKQYVKRTCIANQGYVRLCQHKTVRLSSVRATGVFATTSFACYHPGHIPRHHKTLWLSSRSIFPSMTVETTAGGRVVVSMSYSAHVDLTEHGDGPIAADALRRHIDQLRRGPAKYIAPENPSYHHLPGTTAAAAVAASAGLLEMRCFDPSRCGCLLYRGWPEAGPDREGKEGIVAACADHSASRTLWSPADDDNNTIRVSFASCRHGGGPGSGHRCLQATYHRTIRVDGAPRPKAGDERTLACLRSPRRSRWADLRALDSVRGAAAYGWYQALDPRSYRLTADRDAFGISWCRSPGCVNYPGHLREKLISDQKMNPFCSEGCMRTSLFSGYCITRLGTRDSENRNKEAFWLLGRPRWGGLA